jgi:hypothetical protein
MGRSIRGTWYEATYFSSNQQAALTPGKKPDSKITVSIGNKGLLKDDVRPPTEGAKVGPVSGRETESITRKTDGS